MRFKSTLIALAMLLLVIPGTYGATLTSAASKPPKEINNELTEEQKARLEAIQNRVAEIKAMDKSNLTRVERKAIKKELKDMKKEAKAMKGGVYLSVGAIIIIILLLIILL